MKGIFFKVEKKKQQKTKRLLNKSKFPSSLLFTYETYIIKAYFFSPTYFFIPTLLDMYLMHNLLFKAGLNFSDLGVTVFLKPHLPEWERQCTGGINWSEHSFYPCTETLPWSFVSTLLNGVRRKFWGPLISLPCRKDLATGLLPSPGPLQLFRIRCLLSRRDLLQPERQKRRRSLGEEERGRWNDTGITNSHWISPPFPLPKGGVSQTSKQIKGSKHQQRVSPLSMLYLLTG